MTKLDISSIYHKQPKLDKELLKDIQKNGLQKPIIVKIAGRSKYRVMDGTQRILAYKKLGKETIEAYVYSENDFMKLEDLLKQQTNKINRESKTLEEWIEKKLKITNSIGAFENAINNRPGRMYHYKGGKLFWGNDLTPDEMKRLTNGEVFILMKNEKPIYLIMRDTCNHIRQAEIPNV